MTEMRKARKKVADMSNVKDRGPFNPKHMTEGDYLAKIVEVYEQRNKDDTNDMWVIAFQLQDRRDVVYPYYCVWDENQLWKLRNVFEACGIAVPKKRVSLDPTRIMNKVVAITLEDDEYNGKMKSTIAAVISAKDLDGDEAEPDEDDDDDEVEEEPKRTRRAATTRKRRPEPESEDDEDEDEDIDEEDEPPKRSSRAGGRSVKTSTRAPSRKPRRVVDEDDDDEMDIDEDDL